MSEKPLVDVESEDSKKTPLSTEATRIAKQTTEEILRQLEEADLEGRGMGFSGIQETLEGFAEVGLDVAPVAPLSKTEEKEFEESPRLEQPQKGSGDRHTIDELPKGTFEEGFWDDEDPENPIDFFTPEEDKK